MKEIFKNKNVSRLFIGEMVSSVGDWFNFIAVSILVYELTGSALSLVFTIIAKRAPAVFSSFISGYLADHCKNKSILLWTSFLSSLAVLPLLLVTSVERVWIIYAAYALLSILSLCHRITQRTIIHKMVDENHHLEVNSLIHSSSLVVMTFASSLGALSLQYIGYKGLFIADSLTFLIAFFLISQLKVQEEVQSRDGHSFFKEMLSGAQEVFSNAELTRWFWYMALTSITYCSIGVIITTYPLSIFSMGKMGVGIFNSVYGFSTLLATIVTVKFVKSHLSSFIKFRGIIMALSGVFLYLLGSAHGQMSGLNFFFISTAIYMVFEIFQENVLFRFSPRNLLGRTMAFYKVSMLLIFTLANIAYGKIGELYHLRYIGWIAGSLMVFGPVILEAIFLYERVAVGKILKRTLLLFGVLVLGAGFFGSRYVTRVSETKQSPAPEKEFSLNIHLIDFPSTLDPAKAFDRESLVVIHQLFSPLLSHSDDGSLVSAIAKNWDLSADGKIYRFEIRDDIFFHNGRTLTPYDVEFSLRRVIENPGASKVSSYLKEIESMKVEGHHLIITLKHPFTPFLDILAAPSLSIVPKKEMKENPDFFSHPIGTGPFQLETIDRSKKKVILSRFPKYFNGSPKPKEIVIHIMPETDAVEAFLEGKLDFFNTNNVIHLSMFKSQGLKLIQTKRHGICYLALNHKRAPFDDLKVRQRLYHAFDRSGYQNRILSFGQESAFQFLPRDMEGRVAESNLHVLNPRLSDFSIPKKEVELIKYHKYENNDEDAFLKDLFRKAGLDLNIRYVSRKDFLHTYLFPKNYDVIYTRIFPEVQDPGVILSDFESNSSSNIHNYENREFDLLLSRALRIADTNQAHILYSEASKLLMEDVAMLPLYFTDSFVAIRKGLDLETPNYCSEFAELLHFTKEHSK